jgi:hypothetical protein
MGSIAVKMKSENSSKTFNAVPEAMHAVLVSISQGEVTFSRHKAI